MDDKKQSFVIYQDWMNMVLDLPDEHALDLVRAIFAYCVGRDYTAGAVASAVFSTVKDRIDEDVQAYKDKCSKNAENVRKRWQNNRIRPNTTEYDRMKSNNDGILIYDNDNDNGNDNDVLTDIKEKKDTKVSTKEIRHRYGQYKNVMLSDDDMHKLQEEFPYDWPSRIERLSEYIESKGAKYKNHLATIRAWARKDRGNGTKKQADVLIDWMNEDGETWIKQSSTAL